MNYLRSADFYKGLLALGGLWLVMGVGASIFG